MSTKDRLGFGPGDHIRVRSAADDIDTSRPWQVLSVYPSPKRQGAVCVMIANPRSRHRVTALLTIPPDKVEVVEVV